MFWEYPLKKNYKVKISDLIEGFLSHFISLGIIEGSFIKNERYTFFFLRNCIIDFHYFNKEEIYWDQNTTVNLYVEFTPQ